ncbi:stage III sporulation protein AB [Kyrpidia spormannii]|uniref:Stage III sporulation protein AB n=1 Tax=Kyrpidia spormannii TaxID=2055160 RepID=A0A2K8N4W9_9BACL|nr:stage III sporulation protein SpoIIIAB [Kyrpidia spormannii]ATY84394.1 stage III sporulation protein AB [Kyrpidia spormannii]
MSLLQWVGSAFVLTASAGLGFYKAERLRKRVEALRSVQAGLQLLDTEIAFSATPLPRALARIARVCAPPAAVIFADAAEGLESRPEVGAGVHWEAAVGKRCAELALAPADEEILVQFGRTLGVSDREDQRKHIRMALERLSVQEREAAGEAAQRVRMWRSLGILAGLAVVVLLM